MTRVLAALALAFACANKTREPDPCHDGSRGTAITPAGEELASCVLARPLRERGIICRAGRDKADTAHAIHRAREGHLRSCVLDAPIDVDQVRIPAGARVELWSDGKVRLASSLDAPIELAGKHCPIVEFAAASHHKQCLQPVVPDAGVPLPEPVWYLHVTAPGGEVSFGVPVVVSGRASGPEYRLVQIKDRLAACHAGGALAQDAILHVRVVMSREGLASHVTVVGTTLPPSSPVPGCVQGAMQGAPLENPSEYPATVDYWLRFRATAPTP